MKKYTLLLLSILYLTACQTDSNTAQKSSVAGNSDTPAAATTDDNREPVHVPASTLTPMIGLWHYEAVVGVKDAQLRDSYEGRWINLKGDQTFMSGIWQEQNNAGKWSFNAENQIISFFYDKQETFLYDEFEVQGLGGEVVIFKGNTQRTAKGIQIKMVKYPDRPVQ